MKDKENPAHIKRLKEANWLQDEKYTSYWYDPKNNHNKKGGGLDTSSAFEIQTIRDRLAQNLPIFYLRALRVGNSVFGYIVKRTFDVNKNDYPINGINVFYSDDRENAKNAINTFYKNKSFKYKEQVYDGISETKNALTCNKVLILKEKHGDRHFHVTSYDNCIDTIYSIVKEKIKEGYWYPSKNPKLPEKPFDVSFIKTLPTKELKENAEQQYKTYQIQLEYYHSEIEDFNLVQEVKKGNKFAAVRLFESHSNGEYENWTVEDFSEID